MATKTTIDSKGVTSNRRAGNNELFLDPSLKFRKGVQNAGPASAAITAPVVVFEGSVAGVTGTLPSINADNVGLEINVLNADTTNTIQLSGSQGINGATLTRTQSAAASIVVAVSSSAGFRWLAF